MTYTHTADGADGSNARLTLPPDVADATRFVHQRLKKLLAERAWIASRLRDVVQDAKKHGYRTGATRKAMSFDAVTPEKLEKQFEDLQRAAQLFGMTLEVFEGDIDQTFRAFIEKTRHLRREKKEVDDAIKELKATAVENKVDYDAIKLLLQKPAKLDEENEGGAEEWFHRLDAIGAFLGFW